MKMMRSRQPRGMVKDESLEKRMKKKERRTDGRTESEPGKRERKDGQRETPTDHPLLKSTLRRSNLLLFSLSLSSVPIDLV